ncbi:MAG: PH domain-containing protein, partial [Streptosporangiaceae bacterium]
MPGPELPRGELLRPGPRTGGSLTAGPLTGPLTAGTVTTGPLTTGPLTTGPLATGPEVPLLPLGNGPGLPGTQPFAAGPGAAPATAPRPDLAGSSTPSPTAPGLTAPGASNPGVCPPGLTAPGLTAPGQSNPGLSNPGLSNPGLTAPPWLTAPGPSVSWQRLSRRSMVVRPLTDLVRLLPLLAGLILLHSQTGGGLVWGIAAAVFAVITGLVHWVTTRYQITAERVYLRRGLLNQKTLSVARDRIRTVDITAHVLHRVLGVCRVSIGTGRNDLRSAESFHLDGVTRAEADSLRLILLPGLSAPGTSAQAAQAAQAHAAHAAQAARTPQA